jgi:hypothetical protein
MPTIITGSSFIAVDVISGQIIQGGIIRGVKDDWQLLMRCSNGF